MINLEYNLGLNQRGGTEADEKLAILGVRLYPTKNRFMLRKTNAKDSIAQLSFI